jgi:hypothetical protein
MVCQSPYVALNSVPVASGHTGTSDQEMYCGGDIIFERGRGEPRWILELAAINRCVINTP